MPNSVLNRRIVYTQNSLDPDTAAYISYLSPRPSAFFINAVNALVIDLKNAGAWRKLDRFWIFATEQADHARYSLVNPSSTPCTVTGAPTFVASRGYTGVSNTGYLRSNYNPSSDAVNYTLNNCCMGVYSRTDSANSNFDMGASDASNDSWLLSRIASNRTSHRMNASSGGVEGLTTTSLGFNVVERSASNLSTSYQNGVALAPSSSDLSTAIPIREFYLLTRNGNGTPATSSGRQQSLAFVGGDSLNQLAFYNAVQKFATKIGFNV